mgnify:CR=1 FL=1
MAIGREIRVECQSQQTFFVSVVVHTVADVEKFSGNGGSLIVGEDHNSPWLEDQKNKVFTMSFLFPE